jgi:hypothetical protein
MVVNGVPTNRVIFARLEAIQESPGRQMNQGGGPLITFKGVILPSGTTVTPLPEARFHFADFPALAGSAVHFGPMSGDNTYDMVGALELNGCLFQDGTLAYETGGPAGRKVGLTNNIFERSLLAFQDQFALHGNSEEQLTAANNLFYNSELWLTPATGSSGAAWTFVDNIFDNASFHGPAPYHGSGPVGVNHHNAYIGMAANPNQTDRLYPRDQQPGSDPILTSQAYAIGALGNYYLPPSATGLLGTGSRSAGAASLYHFTSLLTNAKEAAGQVNIGPAYLAPAYGAPVDSNNDGIPDFIADRNGDGNEDGDEMPWTSQNNGALAILI